MYEIFTKSPRSQVGGAGGAVNSSSTVSQSVGRRLLDPHLSMPPRRRLKLGPSCALLEIDLAHVVET